MRQKRMKRVLAVLGLGSILMVGAAVWSTVATAQPAPAQRYTGQVREINIDQCGLEPGTYEGSLVLAQARGHQVTLNIPAGTTMQRGDERAHLEQLGLGNYVMVQAAPQPSELDGTTQGNGRDWTWGEIDAYERSPINSGSQGD